MVTALRQSELIDGLDLRQTELPATTLVANGLSTISLPRVGDIIGIYGRFTINHDNDASGDTPEEDGLGRLITAVRIRNGSAFDYFSVHDGRLLQYMSQFDAHRTSIWPSELATVTGAGGARDEVRDFIIDFSDSPHAGGQRDIEPIGAIPAREQDELVFEIQMGTFADLSTASDLTVNSISLVLTPIIVLHGTASWQRLRANGLVLPRYRSNTESQVSSGNSLGLAFNLPVGMLLNKTLIIAVDGSNDRGTTDADIVSRMAYYNSLRGATPWEQDWSAYRRGLQSAYFSEGVTLADWTNVVLLDWGAIAGKAGLNVIHSQREDHILKFTGAATGDLLFFHKGWNPEVLKAA